MATRRDVTVDRGPPVERLASASTGGRTSVTVDYQMVGTLTEQGNIDELADVPRRRG